jgi:hypothetical protein
MIFKPENFRKLSADSKPWFKIRTADSSTLILVKATGEALYANTRSGKDALISRFDERADLLLFAWVGEWHTDIFQLSAEDIANYYRGSTRPGAGKSSE